MCDNFFLQKPRRIVAAPPPQPPTAFVVAPTKRKKRIVRHDSSVFTCVPIFNVKFIIFIACATRNVSNRPITIAPPRYSARRGHNADSDWHVSGVGYDGSIISRRHYSITRFASISFRIIIINIHRRRVRSCVRVLSSGSTGLPSV